METCHCRVTIADTGSKAVQFIRQGQPYDLILMDIDLPDLTGIEVTTVIRHAHGLLEIPIIAVTAHNDTLKQTCLKAGMNDFITKPITQLQLENLLRQWVDNKTGF